MRSAYLGLFLLVTLSPVTAWTADPDSERAALARLIHDIEALEPLVREAEGHADYDARVRFRYDWLREDLERVRMGIREHMNAPRAMPREIPPLRGDYRR